MEEKCRALGVLWIAAFPIFTQTQSRSGFSNAHCGALEYGMNPSFQTWSSRAIVFADAMARPREFVIYNQGSQGSAPSIPLGQGLVGEGWPDPNGLGPGDVFGALFFGVMDGTVPDGSTEPYVIVWEGSGSCSLLGQHVVGEANRTANRVEFFIDPDQGSLNATLSCLWDGPDSADPVRNIHVWLPGMEHANQLFWPPYLNKVRGMSAGNGPASWRTLDWSRVNDYGRPLAFDGFVFDLEGQITPSSPSQGTRRGMCPEFQVAFCNAIGTDLHLSLPHRTNDLTEAEYITFLTDTLTRIRDGSPGVPGVLGGQPFAGLDPQLRVTIELSNEIWNSGFPVNAWMVQQAQANGITNHQQVAGQIAVLFQIADQVFSGPDAARLQKYVGGHVKAPSYLANVLNALPAGTHTDQVGPAAYFRPSNADISAWLAGADGSSCPNCPTPEEVLSAARLSIPGIGDLIESHRLIAEGYTNPDGSHPALVLYEAGANLHAGFQPWGPAANLANQLPAMYDAYVDDLVGELVAHGVERVHWYSFMTEFTPQGFAAYGCWNNMDQTISLPVVEPYLDQGAPKAAAIYRGPPLSSNAPSALSLFRTAGANPASLEIDPPVLGSIVAAQVDLQTTGHSLASLFYNRAPATIPVGNGMVLLTFMQGTPAQVVFPQPGPIATFSIPVPNDVDLCGREIFVQALHFSGLPGFALSNAQDLRFGH